MSSIRSNTSSIEVAGVASDSSCAFASAIFFQYARSVSVALARPIRQAYRPAASIARVHFAAGFSSNGKTRFQSFFMSTTLQPFALASTSALSSWPIAEGWSYFHSRSASV